ncbi:uncharacterized protein LOC115722062 [Cannabis sativa]|uniref:uncharacterized protein LOC115722062 n=1 Tax=Cannabis sativa TaxID=3483 RepID=UPI0029CA8F70|nr:uncharacterized protein LOC115722062 [Cannabis sativa]
MNDHQFHLPMSFFNNINITNNNNNSNNSSQGWDHHHHNNNNNFDSLGFLNTNMSFDMSENSSFLLSPNLLSSEILEVEEDDDVFSTGYLEDALFEFTEKSKRRRLLVYTDHNHHHHENLLSKSYLDSSAASSSSISNWEIMSSHDHENNFNFMTHNGGIILNREEMKTVSSISEEEKSSLDSSSSYYSYTKLLDSANNNSNNSISDKENKYPSSDSSSGGENEERKKRVIKRVAYPFAVVKPGGIEGEVTLNDINERILMPPTRPVKHPVGDFACRPCVSPHGPGLSGKAVVALTKIQTQGRGTITIIRTKG